MQEMDCEYTTFISAGLGLCPVVGYCEYSNEFRVLQ
jgi:hypothetical protein